MRSLLLAALLALLIAPAARAEGASDAVWQPWEPSALVLGAAAAADADWQDLGYAPVEVREWKLTDRADIVPLAAASPTLNRIMWNRAWLAELEGYAADPTCPDCQRAALRQLCATMMHEKGHLLGFLDLDPLPGGGIMTGAVWWLNPPHCTAWVNTFVAPVAPAGPPPTREKGLSGRVVLGEPGTYSTTSEYRARARKFAQSQRRRHR